MAIAKIGIKDIYTNLLLISIANRRNLAQLAKAAEIETIKYVSDYKQDSLHLFQALPEGFNGLYFLESLARKVGSSLGEAYFLTQDRKEEIIINLLKNINPIEGAYCDYYDDSIEGQIEFKGEVRFVDLSDENMVEKFYRAKGTGSEVVDNDLVIAYAITFQRIIESTEAGKTVYYSLYLSAIGSPSSQYIYDDYYVWDGTDGPIADFIDEVISVHERASESNSEEESVNDPLEIVYSIIPYIKAIDSDTKAITKRAYIKVGKEKAAPSFLPVRINLGTHSIYIPFQFFSDHYDELTKGRIPLCESFQDEGYVIRTVLLPISDDEEDMAKDTLNSDTGEKLLNDEIVKDDHDQVAKIEADTCKTDQSQEVPKMIEELIECIYEDTRTVELLDRFEGYGQTRPVRYQRIVIKNSKYRGLIYHKSTPGFNLVIERGNRTDHVGDITLTGFKQGRDDKLSQYIAAEITEDIVEEYLDTDRFYRFSKPFLLRAQNSSNRSGYGWTWDWSNGYGDYTEGTQYGETTDYYFVGVYISSGFFYDDKKRKPFRPKESSVICNKGAKSVGSVIDPPAEEEDLYTIRPYTGTVKSMTDNKTIAGYVCVKNDASAKHYIPVIVDDVDNVVYIYKPYYEDNKTSFCSSDLQLCDNKGTGIRRLKVAPIVIREESTDSNNVDKIFYEDTLSEKTAKLDIRNDLVSLDKEENVTVAKKKATVIKALKSGDLCPTCGKPNANPEMIEVVDTNGNARTINGLQCTCGTVYLTKKQYKKISNKAHLKIIEVNAPKMTATTSKQVMIKNNPDSRIDHGRNKIRMARGCVKCGKGPIAAGALSKGLRLCWECYKEEMSSTYDY